MSAVLSTRLKCLSLNSLRWQRRVMELFDYPEIDRLITERAEAFDITLPQKRLKYIRNEVIQTVLNYCNLTKLPKALFYTVAKMVTAVAAEHDSKQEKDVASVKVGDVSVTFRNGTDAQIAKVLDNHIGTLQNFRKLKWGGR